jgi:predicted MFS family arabinose efflux permease
LGVALGGVLSGWFGWRWSLAVMALLGLALVALHRVVLSDEKLARYAALVARDGAPAPTDPPERD